MSDAPFRGKMTWDDKEKKLVPYGKQKAEVNAPSVWNDECCVKSMVDGKIYTSKAALRKHYRATGHIEIGNETDHIEYENLYETREYKERLEAEAAKTYYEIRDGNCPYLTELDREICKRMDHNREHYNYDRRELDDDGNPRE